MTKYTLPELPYDYAALEPHLSGKILQNHHDKHHKAYVDGANNTLAQLEEARSNEALAPRVGALHKQLAFHVSGHVLHSLYWQNMAPKGGGEPEGELKDALLRDFGGFEQFKKQLTTAASTVMGSGWGALVYEPVLGRLMTVQIHDHQSDTAMGAIPIMVLDAWEHAWYLQYGPAKADYFKAIWNVWNWPDIQQRYLSVRGTNVGLKNAAAK